MCYYVMSCNYFLSVTIFMFCTIMFSSVGLQLLIELYPPVDCSLNNNIWPRYKC